MAIDLFKYTSRHTGSSANGGSSRTRLLKARSIAGGSSSASSSESACTSACASASGSECPSSESDLDLDLDCSSDDSNHGAPSAPPPMEFDSSLNQAHANGNAESESDIEASPSYSPSVLPPDYTLAPSSDEQRLQFVPMSSYESRRSRTRRLIPSPNAEWTKKQGNITIVLSGQEEGVEVPTFGPGIIEGKVCLNESMLTVMGAEEVKIKLEGRMTLSLLDSDASLESNVVKTLLESYTLWSSSSSSPSVESNPTVCPATLPFSIPLQTTFISALTGERVPLPPSTELSLRGTPGIIMATEYTITVVVKMRKGGDGSLRGSLRLMKMRGGDKLQIPFRYLPRESPRRPLPRLSTGETVTASLTDHLEEWHHDWSYMKSSKSTSVEPDPTSGVYCHFFIPSVRTFALTDTIPFHVQLSGSKTSLEDIIGTELASFLASNRNQGPSSWSSSNTRAGTPNPDTSDTSRPASLSRNGSQSEPRKKRKLKDTDSTETRRPVSVSLVRQVNIEVGGKKASRTIIIGMGKMWLAPSALETPQAQEPAWSSSEKKTGFDDTRTEDAAGKGFTWPSPDGETVGPRSDADATGVESIDWEGKIRCKPDFMPASACHGGFNVGNASFKDYIVVAVQPAVDGRLAGHKHAIPIKLVTDSY